MTRLNRSSFLLAGLGALALLITPACVGGAPGGGGGDDDDPGVDAGGGGGGADAGQNPQGLSLSGMVMDYNNLDILSQADVSTEGLLAPLQAISGIDGSYSLADVPPGSLFYVTASRDNYLPTRQEPIEVIDASVQANIYVTSQAFVQRQYSTVNVPMIQGTGFIAADLRRNNGTPLEGVLAGDILLVDALEQPVGDGPYLFGIGGDITLTAPTDPTVAINGRARLAYLNVPPGLYTLRVPYLDGQGNPQLFEVPVTVLGDASTLTATGNGGGGGGNQPANVNFLEHVYPILQRASLGGDACADCHTAIGQMAGFQFDLDPTLVYNEMLARPNVVDLIAPEASLILSKPMYEDPPNHPNATWANALDDSYMIVMQWIIEGAVYDGTPQQ